MGLGLRAKELASLKGADIYETDGKVRSVVHLKAAYTKDVKTRVVFVSSLTLRKALARYGETRWLMSARSSRAPPFPRQKREDLTAASMARFLNDLYREAGVVTQPRTGTTDAYHGARRARRRLKSFAQIAGRTTIRTTAMDVEANPTRLARILQDVTFFG